jgi:predicted metal-dependent HD superfamily phosphohydrolase
MTFEGRVSPKDPVEAAVTDITSSALAKIEESYGPNSENPKTYHNIQHTVEVMHAVDLLAHRAVDNGRLGAEDYPSLMLSAACHDVVHDPGVDSEGLSAEYAAEQMRQSGALGKKSVHRAKQLIGATRMKNENGLLVQSADKKDYAQQLLADADLANLGKPFEQYWSATTALYKERCPEKIPSIREVAVFGYDFIKGHQFYTQEAYELFPHKDKNLEHLEDLLHILGPQNKAFTWDEQFDWEHPVSTEEEIQPEAAEPAEARKPRKRKYLVALGMAAAFLAGAAVSGKSLVNFTEVQPIRTITHESGCPTVSKAELNKVHLLLNAPDKPGLTKAVGDSAKINSFVKKEANLYGLTQVDGYPYRTYIKEKAQNPGNVIHYLNQYASELGFTVEVHTKKSKPIKNVSYVDMIHSDVNDFKRGAYGLMNAFFWMPKQEIKAIGLKKIRIVGDFYDGKEEVNIGATASSGGVITIGLAEFVNGSSDIYRHEAGHIEDRSFCGNFGFDYYDPQYRGHNPGDFEYGVEPFTHQIWEDTTVSEYGTSNMAEDKAEMYTGVLGPLNRHFIHSRFPAIRKKEELLIARLNTQVPHLTNYLAAISVRKTINK